MLDASVVVDLVLATPPRAERIHERILHEDGLHAPHLLDAEVGQALRRGILWGELGPDRADLALERLETLPLTRHEHLGFLPRALELRDRLTVYDALYLALSEALDAPLLTGDRGVAAAGPLGELL